MWSDKQIAASRADGAKSGRTRKDRRALRHIVAHAPRLGDRKPLLRYRRRLMDAFSQLADSNRLALVHRYESRLQLQRAAQALPHTKRVAVSHPATQELPHTKRVAVSHPATQELPHPKRVAVSHPATQELPHTKRTQELPWNQRKLRRRTQAEPAKTHPEPAKTQAKPASPALSPRLHAAAGGKPSSTRKTRPKYLL